MAETLTHRSFHQRRRVRFSFQSNHLVLLAVPRIPPPLVDWEIIERYSSTLFSFLNIHHTSRLNNCQRDCAISWSHFPQAVPVSTNEKKECVPEKINRQKTTSTWIRYLGLHPYIVLSGLNFSQSKIRSPLSPLFGEAYPFQIFMCGNDFLFLFILYTILPECNNFPERRDVYR